MATRRLLTGVVSVTLSLSLLFSIRTPLAHASMQCKEVYSIFARGSGEKLNDHEVKQFSDQLDIRLANIPHEFVELGKQEYSSYQYTAVSVNPWDHTGTIAGAWVSGGYANSYGDSVMEGVDELIHRVVDINHDCPNSQIVLAGYSQGAQVMGQFINATVGYPEIQDQITFVALFGDPKLNLPEGRGLLPPACKNEQLSAWRREVPDCNTDDGSLGARNPYLPAGMENKVGLWCNDDDFVCGSSKIPWKNSGHGEYYSSDGAIDHAVLEIAKRIKEKNNDANINVVPDPTKIPHGSPDVMIVVDNSNQSEDLYDQFVIPTVNTIANAVTQQGGRVGLQTYDGRTSKSVTYYLPLSNDPAPLIEQVRTAWHLTPQIDLSQALLRTIKSVKTSANWKDGVEKTIIIVPRVPFSSPPTTASALLSETSSDIHLYSVSPPGIKDTFNNLEVDLTKNKPIELSEVNTEIVKNVKNPQLIARLHGANIIARPHDQVAFDASISEVYDDTITRYDWDFNGDGITELSTTEPTIQYKYPSVFNGAMRVTIYTQGGLASTAAQRIDIKHGKLFSKPANAPAHVIARSMPNSSMHLSWQPTDNSSNGWVVALNDTILGRVAKNQHYINISDVRLNQENTFSVRAIEKDGTFGKVAYASTKCTHITFITPTKDCSPNCLPSFFWLLEHGHTLEAFDSPANQKDLSVYYLGEDHSDRSKTGTR